jgi:hypothetical protein
MNYCSPIQRVAVIDSEVMKKYYLKGKAVFTDLPDFYQIEWVWTKNLGRIGVAAQVAEDRYQIGLSRPYMRAKQQLEPESYDAYFQHVVLHELSHLSEYVRGNYHAHHNSEWKREFGRAVSDPTRCIETSSAVSRRAKEIARTL